jgi:hypothetical protein
MIPVLERAKTFHVIGRTATVIVFILNYFIKLLIIMELHITHHVFGINKYKFEQFTHTYILKYV